jgi:hypothetical protein
MDNKECCRVFAREIGRPQDAEPDVPGRRIGRRFARAFIMTGTVLLVLASGGCGKSPEEVKAAKAVQVAQTTGRLVVKSNRPNTTVEASRVPIVGEVAPATVKGPVEGAAEQTLTGLPAGKYTVVAHAPGWADISQELNIEVGRATEIAVNFKSGSLRLDSDPSGATVKQGDALLGKTPLVIPQLPPGECQLTVQYPSWPAFAYKTTITEGVDTSDTMRLPHGKLTVESSPTGATVLRGGRAIGQTPLTVEKFPAGMSKLTLQARDFPSLEVTVTLEDRGDLKLSPALGAGFPELDPAAVLRAVWVPDSEDKIAPSLDAVTGPFQPQNGIVKNLHRKRLYENWLRKNFRFTGTVKSYDKASGQLEFAEQKSELSKYRVLAKLSPASRNDPDLAGPLAKDATFTLYGKLTAVEEPRWPSRVITFELSAAELLH